MKISIFSAFYPFRGGIAQFNERLVTELRKANDVECFTFKKQYPDLLFPGKSQFVDEKAENDPIKAWRIVSSFNPLSYFSSSKRIVDSKPDVFIVNYWMTFFAPFTAIFGKNLKGKAKRIAIVHNLIPHEKRFFDDYFNRMFLRNYDGFVVLSEAVKQDVLRLKPDANILLEEHPLYDHFKKSKPKEELIAQFKIDPNKKTLLFFGLIRDYKGLDNLIKAMRLLPDDYQLIIAGEVYGDEERYLDLIQKSGKEDSIYFFNEFISDSEVANYFALADCCVLPYKHATQSGVTAVSHYFNVPVIATNVGGLKETITHGKTGFIIEESSYECIAKGIVDFFNTLDQNELKANIEVLKEERSWKRFASKLVLFAEEIND